MSYCLYAVLPLVFSVILHISLGPPRCVVVLSVINQDNTTKKAEKHFSKQRHYLSFVQILVEQQPYVVK